MDLYKNKKADQEVRGMKRSQRLSLFFTTYTNTLMILPYILSLALFYLSALAHNLISTFIQSINSLTIYRISQSIKS